MSGCGCDVELPRLSLGRVAENVPILAGLASTVAAADRDVAAHASFVAPYGFVVLEALRRRHARRGRRLVLHETSQGDHAQPFSRIIGFDGPGLGSETTIPLRSFETSDVAAIGAYLHEQWASRAEILGGATTAYVVDSVAEIFLNGLTHARSDVGVVASGQYFPARQTLALSVVDLGIGIPGSLAVRLGRREEAIDPARALAWAFERGSSTIGTSRGLGLAIFFEFLARSNGALTVISGSGLAHLTCGELRTSSLPCRFPGTLLDLAIPTAKVRRPIRREEVP